MHAHGIILGLIEKKFPAPKPAGRGRRKSYTECYCSHHAVGVCTAAQRNAHLRGMTLQHSGNTLRVSMGLKSTREHVPSGVSSFEKVQTENQSVDRLTFLHE